MEYENYTKAVNILKMTRKHVEQTHNDAETKHDNYGEFYMDDDLYRIMEKTENLLSEIDEAVAQFENIYPAVANDAKSRRI